MSILQDFYNGELLPWEQFGNSNDEVYKMYSKNIAKLEGTLMENMTEEEQKVFSELNHLKITQNNMELERMFLYAFRMGAEFAVDVFL